MKTNTPIEQVITINYRMRSQLVHLSVKAVLEGRALLWTPGYQPAKRAA